MEDQPFASSIWRVSRWSAIFWEKLSMAYFARGAEVKYARFDATAVCWPIRVQCRMLGVSVAGYHEHFVRRLHLCPASASDRGGSRGAYSCCVYCQSWSLWLAAHLAQEIKCSGRPRGQAARAEADAAAWHPRP